MAYQYGLDEADVNNWQRLISSEQRHAMGLLIPNHGFIFYLNRNCVYLLDSWDLLLNTSALPGNRYVYIAYNYEDRVNNFVTSAAFVQPALRQCWYQFMRDCDSTQNICTKPMVRLPNVEISNGAYITIWVDNFLGGDMIDMGGLSFRCLEVNK
jgi:hypothetical protein